jgi:hypothetical protein
MTHKRFIEILEDAKYPYELELGKIIVYSPPMKEYFSLARDEIPPNIVFKNKGNVFLNNIEELPSGIEFRNGGDIQMGELKDLPSDVVIANGGTIFLRSIEKIHPGVEFNNGQGKYLESVSFLSVFLGDKNNIHTECKIDRINNRRLINFMIKKGLFI